MFDLFLGRVEEEKLHVLHSHCMTETVSPCVILMAACEVAVCTLSSSQVASHLSPAQLLSQRMPILLSFRIACDLRGTPLPTHDWFRNEQVIQQVKCEQEVWSETSEENLLFLKREQRKYGLTYSPWTLLAPCSYLAVIRGEAAMEHGRWKVLDVIVWWSC